MAMIMSLVLALRCRHAVAKPARARRSGLSSVKMLRELNSAGLAKVRIFAHPVTLERATRAKAGRRNRSGPNAQSGTCGSRYCLAR